MKMPQKPPPFSSLQKSPKSMSKVLSHSIKPETGGKYRHWDTLRNMKPPKGLTLEEWWFCIKLNRQGNRVSTPLSDTKEDPFSFSLTDPMLKGLHQIDLQMGGGITLPDPITNFHTRNDYLVRSLIEEAIASSQLEGASTTRLVAREMLRSGRKPKDKNEQMIYNNYLTMERIREIADQELTEDLILEIHRLTTQETLVNEGEVGRFRKSKERVVVEDVVSGDILHEPPPAHLLKKRIKQLCEFANEKQGESFIHPVLRAIIVHFWLAYDHPFVDGNGRTARALFYWTMLHNKYWLFEFISISPYLLKAPVKYARSFLYTETDDNDLNYFVLHQMEVIDRAIEELYLYIEKRSEENQVFEQTLKFSSTFNYRQEALLLHALKHPRATYTIQSHKNSHKIAYDTARNDLLELESNGLLLKKRDGNAFIFIASKKLLHSLN